jgi:hypothetical protein
MTERIRLRSMMAAREEQEADFAGADELRQRISAASSTEELRTLQVQHRQRRLAAQGHRSVALTASAPSRLPAAATPEHSSRDVQCIVASFGTTITGSGSDGRPFNTVLTPESLDLWMRRADPHDVDALIDHAGASIGRWVSFQRILDRALLGVLRVAEGDEGDELLAALDEDASWRFSIHWHADSLTTRETTLRGSEVVVYDAVSLLEAGPTRAAADDECVVLRIGGRPPLHAGRSAAIERDEQLAQAFGFRPRKGGWHVH